MFEVLSLRGIREMTYAYNKKSSSLVDGASRYSKMYIDLDIVDQL